MLPLLVLHNDKDDKKDKIEKKDVKEETKDDIKK